MEGRRNSILDRIENLNLDDHDEETLKRLCLEVPCTVDVTYCNVVKWFERQVQQKMKKNDKWQVYLDKSTREAVLRRKGAYLYEKYLEGLVGGLRRLNQNRLRREVWIGFRRRDKEKLDECELSIDTLFNSFGDTDRSLLSISQTSSAVAVPTSSPFDCDLELSRIITSTQQSQYNGDDS